MIKMVTFRRDCQYAARTGGEEAVYGRGVCYDQRSEQGPGTCQACHQSSEGLEVPRHKEPADVLLGHTSRSCVRIPNKLAEAAPGRGWKKTCSGAEGGA